MKNIYILPTDKPSRIVKNTNNQIKLTIQTLPKDLELGCYPQYIYITSDEKIKELDWFLNIKSGAIGQHNGSESLLFKNYRKIILTTDQDLIKDGVQSIDDDFLEWFVKNPSCESVKIDLVSANEFGSGITVGGYGFDKFKYKIILPKEEPKQCAFCKGTGESKYIDINDGTIPFGIVDFDKYSKVGRCPDCNLEPKQKFPQLGTKEFNNLASTYFGGKPQEEPKQYPIGGYAPENYTCTCITCKERFFGDKRAVQCEPCAIEMVNAEIDINKEGSVEETKPEPNFYEKLKEYFKNTPREKVLEDWNKSSHLDNVGPTVDEFIENSQEQRLKEAANSIYPNDGYEDEMYCDLGEFKRDFFIEGVKSDAAKEYWFEKFQQEQDKNKFTEKEVESICIEMVNWTIDNIGNPNAKSGEKFEQIIEQFKNK